MDQRIIPPFRGVSNSAAFFDQPRPMAPPDALENVLTSDPDTDRPRMATRPGTEEYFPGTFGGGLPAQGSGTVKRGRTPSGYTLGPSTDIGDDAGTSHIQGPIAGQDWVQDATWGLTGYHYEDVSPAGEFADTGPVGGSINAVGISGSLALVHTGVVHVTARSYVDGSGRRVVRVTCRSSSTMATIWSRKLATVGVDRFVNSVAVHPLWCFVFTNDRIHVLSMADGTDPAVGVAEFFLGGWADEAIAGGISSDFQYLYALFNGTSAGRTLGSGAVVTAGKWAQHFGAGVMQFKIAKTTDQLATQGQAILRQTFSAQLPIGNRYYEGAHGYCRFSEKLPWAPRGAFPLGIAMLPNDGFAVIHANASWGPNGNPASMDYRAPDGSAGYWNVTAFSPTGEVAWVYDCDSVVTEFGDGGFFNDIPTAPGQVSTATAIDADADKVVIGGRRTLPVGDPDGLNVFALSTLGDFLWAVDLGQRVSDGDREIIRENAVKCMPGTMNVVVGGDLAEMWPGGGGAQAQLWELKGTDGTIIRYQNLGVGSTLGIAARADGVVFHVTDYIS